MHANFTEMLKEVPRSPAIIDAVDKWNSFIEDLDNDNAAIVFHADADGVISAAILLEIIQKKGVSRVLLKAVKTAELDYHNLIKWLGDTKASRLMFLDLGITQSQFLWAKLNNSEEIRSISYDHHVANTSVLENRVVLTSSGALHGERDTPAFIFASQLGILHQIELPVYLAIVGFFAEGVERFYERETSILLDLIDAKPNPSTRERYLSTPCANIALAFRTAIEHNQIEFLVSLVRQSINDAMTVSQFSSGLRRLDGQTSKNREIIELALKKARQFLVTNPPETGKLVAFKLEAPHSVAGPVASIIRGEYPGAITLTSVDVEGRCVVEIRTRNDTLISLPMVLAKVAERVRLFNHGGHPSAAGASLEWGDYDRFLRILQEEITFASVAV